MSTKSSGRHDPRIARTRLHAIQATLELATEVGISGCTFENVSERSGISRSTLYRHWDNKSELLMDALQSQFIERIAPDTGNLRDDMLTAMLGLGHALEQTTWGGVTAQLLAAAAIDPEMRRIQQSMADHHVAFDSNIIKRAIKRGELSEETEPEHTALLFSAPIFFRHLFTRQATDPKWITAHVDRTIKLITGC